MDKKCRIVNINYMVDGLRFDAAVDCDWQLHAYGLGLWGHDDTSQSEQIPVELYCYDHKDWDIRMVYIKGQNDQQDMMSSIWLHHSFVDFDEIIKETKEWIKEMTENGKNENSNT